MPLNSMTVIDIGLRDIRHRSWCEILAVLGRIAAEMVVCYLRYGKPVGPIFKGYSAVYCNE